MSRWLTEQMRRDDVPMWVGTPYKHLPDFDLDAQLLDIWAQDCATPQMFKRRLRPLPNPVRSTPRREEIKHHYEESVPRDPAEVRRAEDVTAQQWGYRSMEELQNDARLFCYGIGSHYFDDVYQLLREELKSQPEFALALDMLVNRLRLMRDKLEAALPTATGAPVIPGESIEVKEPEHVVQD